MKKKVISIFLVILSLTVIFSSISVSAISYDPGFEPRSNAICFGNLDTDTIVYQKQADQRIEPASTTKIMTYIVAVEHCANLDNTMITVTENVEKALEGTDSSLANLKVGETMSMYEMLNCMMLPSGNDAAMSIAYFIGNGDVNSFVDMMNEKAQELGCENTHFANPDGLHDPNHYTTANDMYTMTKYAMSTNRFMDICSQTEHDIPATNMHDERTIVTTNEMMNSYSDYYYPYTRGIKTGWHDQAGKCIVSTATTDGYTYLCVAMGAPTEDAQGNDLGNGAMLDSRDLYRWAFKNFSVETVATSEEPVTEVDLNLCWGNDSLLVTPEKDVTLLLPSDVSEDSIVFSDINVPDELNAPINKGDIVGTATLTYGNQELGTVNLVANETANRSGVLFFLQILKDIFTSFWFWLVVIVIVALIVAYIIMIRSYNKKSRHSKQVKKYRNF